MTRAISISRPCSGRMASRRSDRACANSTCEDWIRVGPAGPRDELGMGWHPFGHVAIAQPHAVDDIAELRAIHCVAGRLIILGHDALAEQDRDPARRGEQLGTLAKDASLGP